MKMRLKWFVIPAFALGLGACKKEGPAAKGEGETTGTPGVVEKAVDAVKDAVAEVVKPSASAEERGAKLGFAKYLPKETDSLISFHNAAKTVEKAKALKFWKLVEDEMGVPAVEEGAADPEAAPAAPEGGFDQKDLWGSEVTIALGDTGGEQVANLLHLYSRLGYFQMREMTKGLVQKVKSGSDGEPEAFSEQMFIDLANDPESGISTFEKLAVPPIYIAAKVDAAKREEAAMQISTSLGIVGALGDVEPVELERAGGKFAGYKISGAKVVETMGDARGGLEGMLEAEQIDRLFASIAKKDLVILSGVVGDYVVLFLGGSEDQFQLAATADESLAGNKESLGFADDYLSKDIMAYSFGGKESFELLMESAGSMGDTFKGIRDGLAGEDGLGETREIESLLQAVIEREEAMRKFTSVSGSGTVAFFEDGLKIESFGGVDQGALDWKASNRLSHLGGSSDVIFFANATSDAAYSKASTEFVESLAEAAYAISRKIAALPEETEDLAEFKQMSNLFDEKFREDAVGLWQAIGGDLADGLGNESAVVVDIKGSFPTVPGIPQAVIDQAKVPRVSIVAPVTDRTKLASSWDKLNKNTTAILAKVSEISGKEIPMQKPLSSEKDGLVTWFFPLPFFNDDFLPSITVGDKWFAASTSKLQALDLIAAAEEGGDSTEGLAVKMNLVRLQAYAKETLAVVDANAEALFGERLENYTNEKEQIVRVIDAFDDFDSMTVRSRREHDVVRTSVHFKTR